MYIYAQVTYNLYFCKTIYKDYNPITINIFNNSEITH